MAWQALRQQVAGLIQCALPAVAHALPLALDVALGAGEDAAGGDVVVQEALRQNLDVGGDADVHRNAQGLERTLSENGAQRCRLLPVCHLAGSR